MDSSSVRNPFTLYILWHRENEAGPDLAREVYRWFSAPTRGLRGRGLGIPVYYRSMPTGRGGRPIALEQAGYNLIVPLIDDGMVLDQAWSQDIEGFFAAKDSCKVVPAALTDSAFHLPGVTETNCLRLIGIEGVEAQAVELRRRLTEVAARYIRGVLAAPGGAPIPEKLKIFLSHAKSDGRDIAASLKTAFTSYGQLEVFFDEADLAIGYEFANTLDEAARTGSAGVLSVVTDSYASRPWCRRELANARTPRGDGDHANCWHIQPCVAVSALTAEPSRSMPELGRSSLLPWQPGHQGPEIDLTVREILIAGYHRMMCRALAEHYKGEEGRRYINWVPDPISLLDLLANSEGVTEIVFPGHGLARDTRAAMSRRFQSVRLTTFEELS